MILVVEAGINHNGSLDTALQMVRAAAECGVDAVKFQTYKTEEFCKPEDPLFSTFKECELPSEAWPILKTECDRHNVEFMSTPQNVRDLDLLLEDGLLKRIKIGSDDFTNLPLIKEYASRGFPLILSIGMSDESDIVGALNILMPATDTTLLVCTSEYPCSPEDANLERIKAIREGWSYIKVGFSDHTEGPEAAIMAVALGACMVEKHFTLDKTMTGPDHWFSCDPAELRVLVQSLKKAKAMLGTGALVPSATELANKPKWQRNPGQQLRGR